MKFKQPSLGTKAAIFLPFLISWTRAHLRMAELGCLASIPLHRRPTAFQMRQSCRTLNGLTMYIPMTGITNDVQPKT